MGPALPAIHLSLRQSTHVRRAMRSFVTSVSGSRSSPDPVRFCAQYASSTRHVSDSATFLRSTISPTFTPSPADVRCKISAYHRCRHRDLLDRQSTSSTRRQPRPPCGRWTCSSAPRLPCCIPRSCAFPKSPLYSGFRVFRVFRAPPPPHTPYECAQPRIP